MPKIAAAKAERVASRFAEWFRAALKRSDVTIGHLVYLTRPHVSESGTELSHSNLKKIAAGDMAPTVPTVLRLVNLMASTYREQGSSTLSALASSYPEVIARIVIGLDLLGLERYWEVRRMSPQVKRQNARVRTQEHLALAAAKAMESCPDYIKRKDKYYNLAPHSPLTTWMRKLQSHLDLLAITIAYSHFGPYYGDTPSMELRAVLSCYEERREALFRRALRAYDVDFASKAVHNDAHAHDILAQVERLLSNSTAGSRELTSAASPLFAVWANVFAYTFVETIPLGAWLDPDGD